MLGKRLIYLLLNMSIIEQMVVIAILLVVYLSVVNNSICLCFGYGISISGTDVVITLPCSYIKFYIVTAVSYPGPNTPGEGYNTFITDKTLSTLTCRNKEYGTTRTSRIDYITIGY